MSADPAGADTDDTSHTPTSGRLGPNYFKLFGASTISNLGDGIGVLAYPWLASAITRNPLLIALVAVVQRLPWLMFSLPAGVVTDRMSRRTLMIRANATRFVITLGVAFLVLSRQDALPGPDALSTGAAEAVDDMVLYVLILVATLLLGVAEVFYDNAAQTYMPAVVHTDDLERANGRLWSIERVANEFVGPPLGSFLLAITFALPFFVDAVTFAASAALVALIPSSVRRTTPTATATSAATSATFAGEPTPSWRTELKEGFGWLWRHPLLRPMAVVLGMLNAIAAMSFAIFVLFAQEVLGTSPTEFALVSTGGAVGGIIGGWTASWIAKKIGTGPSLALTMLGGGAATATIGLLSSWPLVWLLFGFEMLLGTLWNVITVSLRQSIIPDRLLGRVNSVYRFFGWGMIPIGSGLGGIIVAIADAAGSREFALRLPWFVAGGMYFVLFAFAAPKLTTAKIEAAREAGANPDGQPSD